jgi:acetyl-CoA acyltransferase 1
MLRSSPIVNRSRLAGATLRAQWARPLSTHPKGLSQILEKREDDVVITFAKRTAMGRKGKGQLAQYPVDEILRALLKV